MLPSGTPSVHLGRGEFKLDAGISTGVGRGYDSHRVSRASQEVVMKSRMVWAVAAVLGFASAKSSVWANETAEKPGVFRAGAAAVEITPKKLPVVISGGFLEGRADRVQDPLFARALVLSDGPTTIAIVIVDTLMMSRELIDEAKTRAEKLTGIPAGRICVAAVHTHSAPSVMGALGTGVGQQYGDLLPGWIAQSIQAAFKNLAPAKIGWAVIDDPKHTNCRRWIRRPDRIGQDPFGGMTIRAMMHPGYQNPDYIGPAGPKDPGLSVLAVQTPEGRPVALLANYSMHYFGAAPVSADYFGRFSRKMTELVAPEKTEPPLVAMMSQGTAGDLHWMDYSQPATSISIDTYTEEVAKVALAAYRKIEYRPRVSLAAAETKLTLDRRVPDEKRLAWAEKVRAAMKDPNRPTSIPEVYALEQFCLAKEPKRELKLQAFRIGDLGITAIPAEVFGLTGLKIKAQSPLVPTFNLELANGADGYIPPPEQHKLGGYTTWPARTAGLEVQAEPKILEAVLGLLEQVSGKPRRKVAEVHGPYAQAVLASKPAAYWRMGEFSGPQAVDSSGNNHHGSYEDGVVFYLEGPEGPGFCGPDVTNRSPHFAGGRMKAAVPRLGSTCLRRVVVLERAARRRAAGHRVSLLPRRRRRPQALPGDHLGIGGKDSANGKLLFFNGNASKQMVAGTDSYPSEELEPRSPGPRRQESGRVPQRSPDAGDLRAKRRQAATPAWLKYSSAGATTISPTSRARSTKRPSTTGRYRRRKSPGITPRRKLSDIAGAVKRQAARRRCCVASTVYGLLATVYYFASRCSITASSRAS